MVNGSNNERLKNDFDVVANLPNEPTATYITIHIRVPKKFDACLSGGIPKSTVGKNLFPAYNRGVRGHVQTLQEYHPFFRDEESVHNRLKHLEV